MPQYGKKLFLNESQIYLSYPIPGNLGGFQEKIMI